MHFPDRQYEVEGQCRCGRSGTLYSMSELGSPLCGACFPASMQRRVEKTIRSRHMIPKASKVAVAVSGGKDSGALLHILKALARGRLNMQLVALHIDMELGSYSEASKRVCDELCEKVGVELVTVGIGEWNVKVQPTSRWPVCAVCGGIRRPIMALMARRVGADVLATGHTMDDQLVYALKNLLSGKSDPPRPVTPEGPVFARKVKPLFFLPDKAMEIYAQLGGIPIVQEGCPRFLPETHRFKDIFHALEATAPLAKKQFLGSLIKHLRRPQKPPRTERPCPVCGDPTYYNPCPLCRLRELQEAEAKDGC